MMKFAPLLALLLLACIAATTATTFFQEDFGAGWEDRWVKSTVKPAEEAGDLELAEGDEAPGVKTPTDARFYFYSTKFDSFDNEGKKLVFQYHLRHTQRIDCGGGYLKLLPEGFDGEAFDGQTPYNVMFGPDTCGNSRRIHVIITYKGTNYLIENDVPYSPDTYTHVYTLVINPDQTYAVKVDNEEVRSGNLVEDWKFLGPKEIPDPDASKPEDWVDEAEIDDPNDVKPEGWDDIPAQIPDPDAKKPEDWDDDLDGDWVAPTIANPEFKGEWKPKRIPNPDYQGPWEHPKVPNPDYQEDDSIYHFPSTAGVGLEIWQVKSGTVFSNILVTDDEDAAAAAAEPGIAAAEAQKEAERIAAEKAKAEREAAAAAAKEAEGNDDDEEADEDAAADDDEDEAEGHDEL